MSIALLNTPPRSPLNLPGATSLRSWHAIWRGVGYEAGAMLLTGTSPDINLSGTPNGLYDFRIEVTTGGARGTAVVKWSSDGGANYTTGVTTSASPVALGSTGMSANFESGTYVLADTYRSTVKTWTDRSANGVLFEETVGAANQPFVSLTGLNGRPGLLFDGVLNRLKCFDAAFATALVGGEDTPFTVGMVAQCVGAASGNHPFFTISHSDNPNTAQASIRALTSQWAAIKRGDADASDTRSGGTADTSPHRIIYRHNGMTVDVFIDNVAAISAAAQNRSSCTVQSVTLGALLSVANVFGNVIIGEVVTYTGARSNTEVGYLDQYLKNAWAL